MSGFPQRIISLVPSQTELLFNLGLQNQIVGITKFCVHPADVCKNKPKVGGTKNFNFDIINSLQPDLIIGNKEENYKEGIEQLQQKYPVWISDIFTLQDALQMIVTIGELTGTSAKALSLSESIQAAFKSLKLGIPKRVAYFIWRKNYMAAATHTFIDDLLSRCGFINVFAYLNRYPEISSAMLASAKPDYIFLSSEPYPFTRKHFQEFGQICPDAKIIMVDGEMFSWYGSRLLQSAAYFQELIQTLNKD